MTIRFRKSISTPDPAITIVQPGYYAIGLGIDRSDSSRWCGWGPLTTWVDHQYGFRMNMRTWWLLHRVAVTVTWNTRKKAQVDEVGRWKRMDRSQRGTL